MTLIYYANSPNFFTDTFYSGFSMVGTDVLIDGNVSVEHPITGYRAEFTTDIPAELEAYFNADIPAFSATVSQIDFYDGFNNLVAQVVYDLTPALSAADLTFYLEFYEIVGAPSLLTTIMQNAALGPVSAIFDASFLAPAAGEFTLDTQAIPTYIWSTYSTLYASQHDDRLQASGEISQTIYGQGGNDTMIGSSRSHIFYGGAGDDTFVGSTNGTQFFGEDGVDVASFNGIYSDFLISTGFTGSATVIGFGGADTLVSTEYIKFENFNGVGYVTTHVDLFNLHGWSRSTQTNNLADQQTALEIIYDDGRQMTYSFSGTTRTGRVTTDVNDGHGWTTITETFNFAGQVDTRNIVDDNGLTFYTTFAPDGSSTRTVTDAADDFQWASVATAYDNSSTLTSHVVTFDNGIERNSAYAAGQLDTITITDGNDNHGWDRVVDTYNSAGFNTARDVYLDDGSTTHFEYLPLG